MSSRRIFDRRALCLAALFTLTAPLASLSAQEGEPTIFSDVVEVRVVNLEAVVTDRSGNRVTGLSAADFKLTVDGNQVPIEYFSEIQGGLVVDSGPAAGGGLPSLVPGQPVSTSYLVFVDDFFPIERDRNRVIQSLISELPLLNPEDRMAIVAYDGKRLSMLTSWSQSSAALDKALKAATLRPAQGLQRLAEQRRFLPGRGTNAFARLALPTGDFGRLTPEERDYARLLTEQLRQTVSAASATLRSFAQPPGRKVMLLLSGGWPFDPTQIASEDRSAPVIESEFDRGYELYKPLADTANLLGYTLYPVDVPGLQGSGIDASQQTAPSPIAGGLSDEQEVHGSLTYLAQRTGGQAMLNARRGKALGETASDTRSYYWLGFVPTRQRNDQNHRIKLQVLKPGLSLRSRGGYLDFARKTEVTAMVESILLFGSAPPGLVLPVQLGGIKRQGGKIEVPLSVGVPADQVTVLPVGDRYVTEVELRIAVLDEDGNGAEIPIIPLKLDTAEKPGAGTLLRYDTSLKLRRKKHDIVIAVFDPATGKVISNRLEIKP